VRKMREIPEMGMVRDGTRYLDHTTKTPTQGRFAPLNKHPLEDPRFGNAYVGRRPVILNWWIFDEE